MYCAACLGRGDVLHLATIREAVVSSTPARCQHQAVRPAARTADSWPSGPLASARKAGRFVRGRWVPSRSIGEVLGAAGFVCGAVWCRCKCRDQCENCDSAVRRLARDEFAAPVRSSCGGFLHRWVSKPVSVVFCTVNARLSAELRSL